MMIGPSTFTHEFLGWNRRKLLKNLDTPLFIDSEVTLEEAELSGEIDPARFVVLRGRGGRRRVFRYTDKNREILDGMFLVLLAIDDVRKLIRQVLRENRVYLLDRIGEKLIVIGNISAHLGLDCKKRTRSAPRKTREKLVDENEKEIAKEILLNELRGGNVSWTAACNRAAAKLMRAIGREVSGKTLGKTFPELRKLAKQKEEKRDDRTYRPEISGK